MQARNINNDCALNQSQKQCFMMFNYYVFFTPFYLYNLIFVTFELSTCPFYCGIRVTQKADFHFMHLL